jgi:predicted ABC-type ATPase
MPQPFLLVIAGPNGSGKTTLTAHLRKHGIDFGYYINPDDIAASLEGSPEERSHRAQAKADEEREVCLVTFASFSFETVMSHPSKVDVMRRARSLGFHVTLFFVGVEEPTINIARVAQRVAQGGHDVPRDRIVAPISPNDGAPARRGRCRGPQRHLRQHSAECVLHWEYRDRRRLDVHFQPPHPDS